MGQSLFYDEWNSLELRWFPSTADATDAELKTTMDVCAQEVASRHPNTPLVDTTNFHHRPSKSKTDR